MKFLKEAFRCLFRKEHDEKRSAEERAESREIGNLMMAISTLSAIGGALLFYIFERLLL